MCHILFNTKHTLELYRTVGLELLQTRATLINQLHVVVVNKIIQYIIIHYHNASTFTQSDLSTYTMYKQKISFVITLTVSCCCLYM